MPYDVFWHLNPEKLKPFKEAYQKRLEMEEFARWRNGMYVMQAISACFGGTYPENPLGLKPENQGNVEEEEELTEEEIVCAREALVMQLSILEGRNKRKKAREERQRLREQREQESDSE